MRERWAEPEPSPHPTSEEITESSEGEHMTLRLFGERTAERQSRGFGSAGTHSDTDGGLVRLELAGI